MLHPERLEADRGHSATLAGLCSLAFRMLFRLSRPSPSDLALSLLERARAAAPTYPEVGATRQATLPAGYRHDRYTRRLASGVCVRAGFCGDAAHVAGAARAGLEIVPAGTAVDEGATVLVVVRAVGLWTVAPCRVVYTLDEPNRAGFGYGTLPGHPEVGEESFVVSRDEDGGVSFEIRAFSRLAHPLARLGAPLGRRIQTDVQQVVTWMRWHVSPAARMLPAGQFDRRTRFVSRGPATPRARHPAGRVRRPRAAARRRLLEPRRLPHARGAARLLRHAAANIGQFTETKDASVLVAVSPADDVLGGVVYFADMASYGTPGLAPTVKGASGIRLLGVAPAAQGTGAGTALTLACIDRARERGHARVVLHTTKAMPVAWRMYEKLGFERADELDFTHDGFQVFGVHASRALGHSGVAGLTGRQGRVAPSGGVSTLELCFLHRQCPMRRCPGEERGSAEPRPRRKCTQKRGQLLDVAAVDVRPSWIVTTATRSASSSYA